MNREYRRELTGPRVEDKRGGCVVTYPYHQAVRYSRIHLQREMFSLRVLSLVMSIEGIMVLNTEL